MAKYLVDALTDVPEPIRGEYEPHEGKFRLKIEGEIPEIVEKTRKLTEFRDNNRSLNDQITTLKSQLEERKDLDPAEYVKMKDKLAKLEKAGVKDSNDVQAQVQEALARTVKEHVDPLRKQLEAEKTARAEAQERLNKARLREVIGGAVIKAGARQDAVDYLLTKAVDVFQVVDGEVKAKDGKYSPSKVTEPIAVEEWVSTLPKDNAFAFEKSNGGGSKGSGEVKPGDKVLVNPTPQQLGAHAADIAAGKMKVVHQ